MGERSESVGGFCPGCAGRLRRARSAQLPSGVWVAAAFVHQGPIRKAVHALKYRGLDRAAQWLSVHLVELLPAQTAALVAVPRPTFRQLMYGTDPGVLLAEALGQQAGLPVARVLATPPFRRSQVRRRRSEGPRFRLAGAVPPGAVLVDDVLTSGATLESAVRACAGEVIGAVTLTRSPRPWTPSAAQTRDGRQFRPASGGWSPPVCNPDKVPL